MSDNFDNCIFTVQCSNLFRYCRTYAPTCTNNGNFFGDNNRGWWGGDDGLRNNGIPETIKTGIFYSDKLTNKIDIGLNYTYNETELVAESNRNLQYLLRDTSYSVAESNRSENSTQDHLFNGKKVLFVSEKKAALDVVAKKLQDKNLDPFTFKLTATNQKKSEFISDVKKRVQIGEGDLYPYCNPGIHRNG